MPYIVFQLSLFSFFIYTNYSNKTKNFYQYLTYASAKKKSFWPSKILKCEIFAKVPDKFLSKSNKEIFYLSILGWICVSKHSLRLTLKHLSGPWQTPKLMLIVKPHQNKPVRKEAIFVFSTSTFFPKMNEL